MTASKAGKTGSLAKMVGGSQGRTLVKNAHFLQNSLKRGLSPGQPQVRLPLIARLKTEGAFLGS
jgi:hypothetical protein